MLGLNQKQNFNWLGNLGKKNMGKRRFCFFRKMDVQKFGACILIFSTEKHAEIYAKMAKICRKLF